MRQQNDQTVFQFPLFALRYVFDFLSNLQGVDGGELSIAQQGCLFIRPSYDIGIVRGTHRILASLSFRVGEKTRIENLLNGPDTNLWKIEFRFAASERSRVVPNLIDPFLVIKRSRQAGRIS